MKIKEVIEKTNLTDRAIRLYIDNALVSPGIEESYSGRKNIEFSEKDVERLSQIALLRKAGFSISDIKEIISDNGKIEEVVRKFIEETDEEIKSKTEVVEKLKDISFDEKISLEILCEKLSVTVEENEVPEEDTEIQKTQKRERKYFRITALVGFAVCVITVLSSFILNKTQFEHTVYEEPFALVMLIFSSGLILLALYCIIIFALNSGKYPVGKWIKRKRVASEVIIFLSVPLSLISPAVSFASGAFGIFCHSETTDAEDYMVVDSFVKEFGFYEELDRLFPDEIPVSGAKGNKTRYDFSYPFSTKYFYRHTYAVDPTFDIVAEWTLTKHEYYKAIDNAKEVGTYKTIEKGNWTCFYFAGNTEEIPEDAYWYLIFAYNENDKKVRYIASYAIRPYEQEPYFTTLDW